MAHYDLLRPKGPEVRFSVSPGKFPIHKTQPIFRRKVVVSTRNIPGMFTGKFQSFFIFFMYHKWFLVYIEGVNPKTAPGSGIKSEVYSSKQKNQITLRQLFNHWKCLQREEATISAEDTETYC